MDAKRLPYLDSIRGIAAFTVLVHHCWLASITVDGGLTFGLTSFPHFIHYFIGKFLAGRAAVLMFFVLSGFVLAHSLQKQPLSYASFTIKRLFRIYPVFVLVVISSYVLHKLIGIRYDGGNTFLSKEVIHSDLSTIALLKHLALWGTIQGKSLDVVIWSLVHEMRISLLFPVIMASVRKYRWRAVAFYWLLSLACTSTSLYLTGQVSLGYEETTIVGSVFATGYFIVFFAAGALLSIEREVVASTIRNLSRLKVFFLFVLVGLCLLKSGENNTKAIFSDYIIGVGALGLIALARAVQKFQTVLNHAIPVWLGRISYSLYLVHLPVLFVASQMIGATWPRPLTSILVVALSLAIAELTARFIEFPAIMLGKRLVAVVSKPAAGIAR